METLKSRTDLMTSFYDAVLNCDMVRHYGNPSFHKDFSTLKSRVEHEGLSFLTKTLPLLAKALDKALVFGRFTSPTNFKTVRGSALPCFLSGLLERVFEKDGTVKTVPCISAVRDIRQICYLLYKYESGCTRKRNQQIENFVNTDSANGWEFPSLSEIDLNRVNGVLYHARKLLHDVVSGYDNETIVPGHGPGAVASGEKAWEKFDFKVRYECIHESFPYYKYFFINAMDLAANVKRYKTMERMPSGFCKLMFVPKDSRGERIISEEPLEFMWIQQGIKKQLYPLIENHPLTKGHVNFTDQNINRELALAGSCQENIVTLDMKEASDRISLWLVENLFTNTQFLKDILNVRTEATELPDGRVHLLRMFAPMGSALCFPVMSLVHWSLSVASLHVIGNVRLDKALAAVYVFGDDIVVKGQNHEPLYDIFPLLGLKFNKEKSCTAGIFRESCGMDAVNGECVTPIRLKKQFPISQSDASGYVSYIEQASAFYNDGYYSLANIIEENLVKVFHKIPYVMSNADIPGLVVTRPSAFPDVKEPKKKYNKALQKWGVPVRIVKSEEHISQLHRCEYYRKLVTPDGAWRCSTSRQPKWRFNAAWSKEHAVSRRDLKWVVDDPFKAGIYTLPRSIKFKRGTSESVIGFRKGNKA